jgi:hypothetical protein
MHTTLKNLPGTFEKPRTVVLLSETPSERPMSSQRLDFGVRGQTIAARRSDGAMRSLGRRTEGKATVRRCPGSVVVVVSPAEEVPRLRICDPRARRILGVFPGNIERGRRRGTDDRSQQTRPSGRPETDANRPTLLTPEKRRSGGGGCLRTLGNGARGRHRSSSWLGPSAVLRPTQGGPGPLGRPRLVPTDRAFALIFFCRRPTDRPTAARRGSCWCFAISPLSNRCTTAASAAALLLLL